jgi:xylulokinase
LTALVGIDVGTSGLKAVAISEFGDVLAQREIAYPAAAPHRGWSEQDPEDWAAAARLALEELPVAASSIGLSGQMHGLVCLDDSDRVLRPAILWNDQRTAAECREIEETIGAERLLELTGNPALPGFTAPKLLWLRRHEPETYARISRVLLPKDYVRYVLTGEAATDVSDASGTLLLDVGRRRWSDDVLDLLELDRAWLPRLLESPELSGETTAGIPVAGGAGDQAGGALGVGIDAPGRVSVVLGTSGVVFAVLPEFVYDARGRTHAFCHAVPGRWHAMGVMLSAAASLAWLLRTLGADYDVLLAEAAASPAGARGLLFAPYLTGERTPHADPDVRGAFVGLDAGHERGDLVRAVLEGVAYGLRDSFELLRELGVAPASGRLSGGGARSELWTRIVASVLELPLEKTAVEEGAAFGAALLGGVAAGTFADVGEAVAGCVRVGASVDPDPAWVPAYREGYERYGRLYGQLRPLA